MTPKVGLDFASRFGENVGISGGLSYYKRKYEVDTIEPDGWDEDDGLIYADEIQYRDYDVTRERFSASLGLDFRATDTTELYVRGLFSRFDDHEYRRRTTFDLGDADISGSGTMVSYSDASDKITVERDIKDRFERQETISLSWGGVTETDDWKISYMGSYARSSETEDGNLDPTQFEREFEGEGLVVDVDYSDPKTPRYTTSGVADFADPSTYELKDIEFVDSGIAKDEEYAAKFDVARAFPTSSGVFTAQAGFKGRWRQKSYDAEVEFYEWDGAADYTLADIVGTQTFRRGDISPVASYTGATEHFYSNFDMYELQEIDTVFDSAASDYAIDEDVYAAYGLLRFDSDVVTVIGGVRWERTNLDINGNEVLLVEEDGTLPGGATATEDMVFVTPVSTGRHYDLFLPSINVRYQPADDLVLRVAGYRSIVRPGFSKLAPRFLTEVNDDDEVEGEFGNPDLKPYKAWNADLSVEYYFSGNGALTAALFYKTVEDYIVDVNYEADDLDDSGTIEPSERLVYRGIAFDEAVIPLNGDKAEIWGVELGFSQQWTMLPAPFDGLLTQLNYTYTDARGDVPDEGVGELGVIGASRQISLPQTAKHTINAVLGYEKGPVSLRLAGTYRDKYLDELGGSVEEDRMIDDHLQLDFSAKYRASENVQVFYEWVNITEEDFLAYNNVGGRQNALESEYSSWTMKGGVRVTF